MSRLLTVHDNNCSLDFAPTAIVIGNFEGIGDLPETVPHLVGLPSSVIPFEPKILDARTKLDGETESPSESLDCSELI